MARMKAGGAVRVAKVLPRSPQGVAPLHSTRRQKTGTPLDVGTIHETTLTKTRRSCRRAGQTGDGRLEVDEGAPRPFGPELEARPDDFLVELIALMQKYPPETEDRPGRL